MISDLTHNLSHVESVFVRVSLYNKTFIVGSVYRPPNSELETFINFFELIRKFKVESTNIIIGGKYNIDLLKLAFQTI